MCGHASKSFHKGVEAGFWSDSYHIIDLFMTNHRMLCAGHPTARSRTSLKGLLEETAPSNGS